ncbi:MAG: 3-hydroxyacyl-ACP dehydratase FabZ [Luteimonas sp.]
MSVSLTLPLDVIAIQQLLPHRFPFLMIDRITEFEPGKRVIALKNVSINEWFFQGHFPNQPVMPGVLVIEALAQTGGVLLQLTRGNVSDGKPFYLVKIESAKFTRMVVPGDILELEVILKRSINNMMLHTGIARVDGEQVAYAELLCSKGRD